MATLHIGKIIRHELREQHRSVVWLADRLQCNRTSIYKIFNRESLDSELLLRICLALHCNFFELYTSRYQQGMASEMTEQPL